MRQTPNYNLPQFEVGDKFNKETLNEGYSKIDLAISDLQETFNANATGSALTTQEVIEARKGKETLKDRIDGVEADVVLNKTQISEVASQLDNIAIRANPNPIKKDIFSERLINLDNFIQLNDTGVSENCFITNSCKLKLNPTSTDDNSKMILFKNKITDGKISFTWDNPTFKANKAVGVITRLLDYKNFIQISLFAQDTNLKQNFIRIFKVENGAATIVKDINLTEVGTQIVNGKPINVEMEFVGDLLYLYVNGKLVCNQNELKDLMNSISGNYVGLAIRKATNADQKNIDIELSNIYFQKYKYDVNNPNVFKNVLFIGDSIVQGFGATTIDKCFVNLLMNKIVNNINKESVFENFGVGGNNSTECLSKLIEVINLDIEKYRNKVIFIQCGTNDSRVSKRNTIEQFRNNIKKMIRTCKSINAIPILGFANNYDFNTYTTSPTYDADSYHLFSQFRNVACQVASEEEIIFIDNYSLFNNQWSTYTIDGVHPNDLGYELMANNAYDNIFNSYMSKK